MRQWLRPSILPKELRLFRSEVCAVYGKEKWTLDVSGKNVHSFLGAAVEIRSKTEKLSNPKGACYGKTVA